MHSLILIALFTGCKPVGSSSFLLLGFLFGSLFKLGCETTLDGRLFLLSSANTDDLDFQIERLNYVNH